MRYRSIHVVEPLDVRVLFSAVSQIFQEGLNGYAGTEDTYAFFEQPSTSFGGSTKVQVDGDTTGSFSGNQPSHGLLRFHDVFGDGPGQVPVGATITAASLVLVTGSSTSDNSNTPTSLHRMLTDWGESSTWNNLTNGVSANGTEAASSADATVTPASLGASLTLNVTAALQAWAANPAADLGWALLPGGTDGWWWNSSESADASKRPRLTVTYETNGEPATNQRPTVSAGPNLTVTLPASASLNGTVTDDQLPEPPALITSWSQVSGPGTATFADPAAVDTTASFSATGTYVLRLSAGDGELSASDDVTVVVNGPALNQPPAVSAGPNLTVTLPSSASLNGTVTDDQLPEPPALITSWSRVSGPGTATFANPAAVDTTASFSATGTYVLRLTANDGALSASDDVTVVVNAASTPTFGRLDPISLSADTGEKPQSKVWEHAGSWWSVLPNSSGTWLWRLDGTKWTAVLKLSSSTGTKADVLVKGDVTHILLYKGSSSTRLASVEYVPGAPGTYRMWSSRTSLVTIPLNSSVETATLAIDGAGRMWIASDASTTIEVRYSDGPYSTWSSPITIASGTSTDDIAAITSLPNGSVGVLWSNQSAKRFGFRTHAPGASPSTWTANEVPASQSALSVGGGMADDHLNLAVASDGTLYAAVKTSYDTSGRPAIALLVRRPNGQWDSLYSVDGIGNTRPIVVLNEPAGRLRVIYTFNQDSGPGNIVYKDSSLSNISFGSRTTLMSGSFNNASSTRQVFNDSVVIIAADSNRQLHGVRMAWPATQAAAPMLAFASTSGEANMGGPDRGAEQLSLLDTVELDLQRHA